MAEVAAVIGLVASIASLVDLSGKIVSRIRDYNTQTADIPKTFRALADRLPLLTQTLMQIQSRAQSNRITVDTAKEISRLVDSIREQTILVEQCLDSILPASGASHFARVLTGLKSLAKDEKVKQAVERIHRGIDVLIMHQTTSALDVGDHISQELARLRLQRPPSPQTVPQIAAQQTFGLQLGQAPLIEADAIIGREEEIRRLHQWLSPRQDNRGQRVVSIVGMGGLGKTQLSLAYAREHGHQYSSVFWLNAKNETSLRQSMSALSAVLFDDGVVVPPNADAESTHVERVRGWLSEAWNDRWLLIFDNYDDPSLPNIASSTGFDIRQFFPRRTTGSILITTRSSKLAFSKPLKLQKLHDEDLCLAVLSQRSGRDITQDPDSQRLAKRLDGLPLALTVAGTYLAQTSTSCAEYLSLYETAWTDLHGPDAEELMEYEDRTLSSTYTVSLDQVRGQDADAAELLRFFGYLNNDDIWYELIKGGAEYGPSWMGRVTASKIRFDRAMSKLGDYSLVEAGSGSYRIHPCIHDWIFECLNTPLSGLLFVTSASCLERNIPDSLDSQYWKVARRLINHVNRILDRRFTTLWDSCASDESIFDASHLFGIMYDNLCEFDKAERMYTYAVAGKKKVLGHEHISTLNTILNFGILYFSQDKFNEAEQMYIRALAGMEKVLGPDHTSTLETVNNLGNLYSKQGKLNEAEQIYLRALAGKEKVLEPDHTSTLNTVHNLGLLYSEQGKLDEAEQMYIRVLARREKVLGLDHISTLETVYNLGNLYSNQGKLNEAEQMYIRALAGMEKVLGSDHTSTLNTVSNLGLLYSRQGKLDEAEQIYLRALAGKEKVPGPDHTSTLDTVFNLGNLYFEQDKLDEAEQMYLRALVGSEKVVGPDHTSTLRVVNNLGALYADCGSLPPGWEVRSTAEGQSYVADNDARAAAITEARCRTSQSKLKRQDPEQEMCLDNQNVPTA